MSDEVIIQKDLAEVNLVTLGGQKIFGYMFVQPYHPLRNGPELPVDIMNAPEPFFPFLTDEGVILIAKAAIAELDYASNGTSDEIGAMPLGVSVTLSVTVSGGSSYSGAISVEGPVNTPRLLDFMNRGGGNSHRFIAIHSDGRVRLINRAYIETIRSLS